MNQHDIAALLALMRVEGAGNTAGRRALSLSQLLDCSIAEIIAADARTLLPRLPSGTFDAVISAAARIENDDLTLASKHVARMLDAGTHVYAFTDEGYPDLLSRYLVDAAPALVWCAGNLELLNAHGGGVVGTRDPSRVGFEIAMDCARWFANEGITVVSGGADGVDSAAHRAAIESNGSTIIVLPQGMRTYSFPAYVREALECHRCALISQFDPEMSWQTHAAVTRNATIAALSKIVCVIEPKRMGGSIRTAKHAFAQGKKVFYHCARGAESVAPLLRQSGGSDLLTNDHLLDSDALHMAWGVESADTPSQADLL
ncbi:MAG TPA: DNA-processing protein DprA [Candidatus Hydrogenedentes bacterium]|nr:DNA-processing protein DprA [Candidatus Hydrogenedentota bacterium]